MMKLGFNLVYKSKALGVRVLRAKYGVANGLPKHYRVDRKKIRSWRDLWVSNMRPLISLIIDHSSLNLDCLLSDMITDDGAWNLDLFGLLEKETLEKFMESEESGVADSLGNIKGFNGLDSLFGLLSSSGASWSSSDVIKASNSWAKQYVSSSKGSTTKPQEPIPGSYLIENWVCLDTDGFVRYEASFVAAEENCEIEIRGGFVGLTGYDNVLIQTDILEVAKAIQESPSNGSNYALIRRIHQLLS
ncbi:hypothetical protein Goari_017460 [Gossypium aridum]|uniref:RNase H type-1 domain-containing protein n=1 Tax=Gossypium aridum TaxID=34290 RepID=A0A7J8WLL8_GOSAI|nr:hypothetical protein [Gossypium aridum]